MFFQFFLLLSFFIFFFSFFSSCLPISIYVALQAITKPQFIEDIPKSMQGNVGQVLDQNNERDMKQKLCADLELNQVIDRNIGDLSGGELQRFAIAGVAIRNADIYMFDEPSSYLDVKQRLKAAQVVRSLLRPNRFVSFPLWFLF
jgi:ATP-binding cassette, sub-family E, member 1